MKVLLIGGTGVLSSAITKKFIDQGFEVTMVNRGNRKIPEGVNVIKTDKNNFPYIEQCLQGQFYDAVIDFLCYTKDELEKSFRLYAHFTKQYFFISSCAVYDGTIPGVKREDSPKGFKVWSYSVNKWASEQRLMELAKEIQCAYTVIRPAMTYDDTRIPYGISPQYGYHWTMCARALAGKPLIRWNGGVNHCNMMRVEDFADGVAGLIGNPKAYNEAFNVCGDEAPSFNDVLKCIEENISCKISVVDISSDFYAKELSERAGEIAARSVERFHSNEKMKNAVPAFRQTISLKDGVAKTIVAYKSKKYQKGIDWYFDADCDRIIKKWCDINGIDSKMMNLKFVDYLGNATKKDVMRYTLGRYRKNKVIEFLLRIVRGIKGIF